MNVQHYALLCGCAVSCTSLVQNLVASFIELAKLMPDAIRRVAATPEAS